MTDDFSSNPRNWSWLKLRLEAKNGMPAVLKEIERRLTPIGKSNEEI